MEASYNIERMSYGPDGIARSSSGKTVFVSGDCAPGDSVEVSITKQSKSFDNAAVRTVTKRGKSHIDSPCAYDCGGCPWRSITSERQKEEKEANIRYQLSRFGGLTDSEIDAVLEPCIQIEPLWGYRNKIEFNAVYGSEGLKLGLFKADSNEIVSIDTCLLFSEEFKGLSRALNGALRKALSTDGDGLFRVGVRYSKQTKSLEIALWTTPGVFPRQMAVKVLHAAMQSYAPVTSIVRIIADSGSARKVKSIEVLDGDGYWREKLVIGDYDVSYLPSAPSFFQVNTVGAEKLVWLAIENLSDGSVEKNCLNGMRIADLYAGGGTFGIPLAKYGADVFAVESASSSVRDLKRNAKKNGVQIEVFGGDAGVELKKLQNLDAILVDPPRMGLMKDVPEKMAAAHPKKIIYVSCDPATLVRDLKAFGELGYKPKRITPVNLFPQTFHVETVTLLTQRY